MAVDGARSAGVYGQPWTACAVALHPPTPDHSPLGQACGLTPALWTTSWTPGLSAQGLTTLPTPPTATTTMMKMQN